MKKILYILLILTMFMVVACDQIRGIVDKFRPAKTPVMRIGYTDYSFDQAITMVLKGILDHQDNLEVELYRVPDETMFSALAREELDVAITGWLPYTHQEYMDKYPYEIKAHSVVCDSLGIYLVVPSYLPINTIEELRTAGALMRHTIIIPEQENSIYHFAKDIIEDYDLVNFTLQESEWDDIVPFISESLQKTTGFAVVALRPHWIFERYDLKVLTDNRQSLGKPESAYILINTNFPEKMPHISYFLSRVKFSLRDMEVLLEMNQTIGTEPYENAMRWINMNSRKVNMWLIAE